MSTSKTSWNVLWKQKRIFCVQNKVFITFEEFSTTSWGRHFIERETLGWNWSKSEYYLLSPKFLQSSSLAIHFHYFYGFSQSVIYFLSLNLLHLFLLPPLRKLPSFKIPFLKILSFWSRLSSLDLYLPVGVGVESGSPGTGTDVTCDSGSAENPNRCWAAFSHRPVEKSVPALQGQVRYGSVPGTSGHAKFLWRLRAVIFFGSVTHSCNKAIL